MAITKAGTGWAGGGPQESTEDIEETRAAGGKTVTIGGKKGQKPINFKKGGLHQSVGVPADEPIPAGKLAAAKAGKMGPKAKKQATLAGSLAKMRPGSGPGSGSGSRAMTEAGSAGAVVPKAVLASKKRRPRAPGY